MKETDVLPRKKGKKKMKYQNAKGNNCIDNILQEKKRKTIVLKIYYKDTPSTLF